MRIALVIAMLYFLRGAGVCAVSQPPIPSGTDSTTQPKCYTSSAQNGTDNDKSTPKNFPPIIEISKAPIIQLETTEKTAKSRDYYSPEWWLVYITGILALITAALASYTGGLYRASKKLWKTTAQSIELTSQSVELTKQEFITSHPPKFRVHSILLVGSLAADSTCRIQCSVDNIGGSTAHITERNMTFAELGPIPADPPYGTDYPDLHVKVSPVYPGGGTIEFLPVNEQTKNNLRRAKMMGSKEPGDFYFFGYVVFLDDIGTERRIAFCRRYNIKTGRFTAVQDDDYEYNY